MKILFINHTTELYGASRSLIALLEGLQQYKNTEIHVLLSEEGDFSKYLESKNINFTISPFHWAMHYRWYSRFLPKKLWQKWQYQKLAKKLEQENKTFLEKVYQKFKEINFDIIHSNSSVIDIGFYLAQKFSVPHVWHFREFANEHYNLHPNDTNQLFKNYQANLKNICISQKIQEYFFKDNTTDKVQVIYNPIYSKEGFEQKAKQTQGTKLFSQKIKTFTIVGLIHPNKGQEEAIKALAELNDKNVRLIVAGGGNQEKLEVLARKLNVEKQLDFLGQVDNISEVYKQVDAVLMCSKSEAFGRVTVEAMAHKRPVIGLNNAGTAEIIQHQENGLLYKNDYKELAEKMKSLINNPKLANTITENAWQEAIEKYSTENHVKQIYKLYQSILNE